MLKVHRTFCHKVTCFLLKQIIKSLNRLGLYLKINLVRLKLMSFTKIIRTIPFITEHLEIELQQCLCQIIFCNLFDDRSSFIFEEC